MFPPVDRNIEEPATKTSPPSFFGKIVPYETEELTHGWIRQLLFIISFPRCSSSLRGSRSRKDGPAPHAMCAKSCIVLASLEQRGDM